MSLAADAYFPVPSPAITTRGSGSKGKVVAYKSTQMLLRWGEDYGEAARSGLEPSP